MSGSADPTGPARFGRAIRDALWQWLVRTTRTIYLGLERTPLAPLLNIPLVQRVKSRVTYVPAEAVPELLAVLAAAGVGAWLAGGWGVDALAGRQTRRHYDVDVVVDTAPDVREAVAAALTAAGFREGTVEHNEGLAMPVRWAWHDDTGLCVDILPVALDRPPFRSDGTEPFTNGRIAGRVVPCLSAELQVRLHTGYSPRDVEPHDMDVLRRSGARPA